MNKSKVVGSLLAIGLVAFLAGRLSTRLNHGDPGTNRRLLYYVDPMHPAYHSDKPGLAPDCGMPLVPVYEGEDLSSQLQLPAGAVSLSPEKQQLIGIRVEAVEKSSGPQLIRTTGRVSADENRVYRLTAGTDGWVRTLENNPPGTVVVKNQVLATFYSREFRNAEQAYLGSLASFERLRPGQDMNMVEGANPVNDQNLRVNEEQLHALGMGDAQLKDLARKRQITRDIILNSPIDGVVLARNISPEQRFDKGLEFYRIADLSKVWIIADIFGNEAQLFHPGGKVRVTAREQAKTLFATVSNTPPLFDPASRTLKLRLEADNPGLLLRPDMFVDLEFNPPAPPGLSVPQEAVLDSGMQKIVYVETSEGVFEPRPVELGDPYGSRVAVLHGLARGDRVVTSGNFLLDSESRMRSSRLVSTLPAPEPNPHSNHETVSQHDADCGMAMTPDKAAGPAHMARHPGKTSAPCSEPGRTKTRRQRSPSANENARSPQPAAAQMAVGR